MKSRLWLFIWLGSFLLLVAIAITAWNLWTGHHLAAAKARIRAAKLPTTLAEIRPPAVPDADNASPLIEKIGVLRKSPALADAKALEKLQEFRKAEKPPPEELEAIAQLLDTAPLPQVLALAREAAAKPGYDAHLPYERGPALLLNNIGPLRESVAILAASVRLASLRGDRERAAADLNAMLAIAEFTRDEPTLISQLTRIACLGITLEVLEKIVAEKGLSGRDCEILAAKLAAIDLRPGMVRALDGERVAFGSYCFELMSEGKVRDGDFAQLLGMEPAKGVSFFLGLYRFSNLCRLDYAGYLDRMREVRLEYVNASHSPSQQAETMRNSGANIPRYHVMTLIVMPTLASVCQKGTFGQQKIAVSTAGLALERYRQVLGDYPAELASLAPEFLPTVPRDLFAEKPLRYERSPRGAILYSVGANLRDELGTQDSGSGKDDIAWRAGDYEPAAR